MPESRRSLEIHSVRANADHYFLLLVLFVLRKHVAAILEEEEEKELRIT